MTRKTDKQRLEELEAAKEKLAAREKAIKSRLRNKERKDDARRKIIAGAIALEHGKYDEAWGAWFRQVLHNEVKRPADRELLDLPPLQED